MRAAPARRRRRSAISGGYGSIIHGMKYARYRGAIADHSGDAFMNPCMAATHGPDPRAPLGFRIPFNAETGAAIAERWRQWRRHDPVNLVSSYKQNLKSLRGITIDRGWRDQYHNHYGSRILSQRLAEAGIKHRYEEFDDDHSDMDYRMDVSLPFLYRALMR